MQIVLRGAAAGYEAEHTARLFFPGAEKRCSCLKRVTLCWL